MSMARTIHFITFINTSCQGMCAMNAKIEKSQ